TKHGFHLGHSINSRRGKRVSVRFVIPTFSLGMAKPPTATAGSAVLTSTRFKFSPSIACISAAPCVGSRNPVCSCAPATAVFITKTALGPPVLPSVGCSNMPTKLRKESCTSKPANCPPLSVPASPVHSSISVGSNHAPDTANRRVARRAPATRCHAPRNRGASGSERNRELVLCFRERRAGSFYDADHHRDIARGHLRSVGG